MVLLTQDTEYGQAKTVAAEDGGLQGPGLDRRDVQQTEAGTLHSFYIKCKNYLGSEQRPSTILAGRKTVDHYHPSDAITVG